MLNFDVAKAIQEQQNEVGHDSSARARRTPETHRILEAVASGQLGAQSDPPLNVTREALIGLLQERRDLVSAAYTEELTKLATEDDRRTNFRAQFQAHFAAMADALADTDGFKFNPETGKLAPKDGSGKKLPIQPSAARSESAVETAREKCVAEQAAAVAVFDAQLQLLRIGADASIPVVGSAVTALLATPVPSGLKY